MTEGHYSRTEPAAPQACWSKSVVKGAFYELPVFRQGKQKTRLHEGLHVFFHFDRTPIYKKKQNKKTPALLELAHSCLTTQRECSMLMLLTRQDLGFIYLFF